MEKEFIAERAGLGFKFYAIFIFCIGAAFMNLSDATHSRGSTSSEWVFGGLAAVVATVMVLIIWLARKARSDETQGYRKLRPAIIEHMRRSPDFSAFLATGEALFIFMKERKFYFRSAEKPFDSSAMFSSADVREWKVEWVEEQIRHRDRASVRKKEFRLQVRVQSLDSPLLTMVFPSEKMAYQAEELFTRMYAAVPAV